MLTYTKKSLKTYNFDDRTTLHMIFYMQQHRYIKTGEKLVKAEKLLIQHFKDLGSSY